MGDFKDILKSEAQKHRIQLSPENFTGVFRI